mmetsp:Transcript_38424/g.99445  ORF Transcript_38424/g.99445 Transcript_38424/m.99445 type:complete len:448 (-) Transcript_38424:95-1438(-)
MDELYRVGEKFAQDGAGLSGFDPSMLGAADQVAFAKAMGDDLGLAELLGGGGDIEQYLQSYEQMLAQGIQTGPQLNVVDAEGGITVRPEPGFVIKTRDVTSGMKIFINVVSNEHIERPHMKSLEELQGEEGCRVPMSVGTPVEDFDKKSEPCVTYDIVANPEIVEESQKQPSFRENLVSLCLAAVSQKYKIELDPRYKLPKMKYKGASVQLQRIRKSRQSDIEEVLSSNTAAPMPGESAARRAQSGTGANGESADGVEQPEFCIFYSKAGAGSVDGFGQKWPLPPDTPQDAAELDNLSGWDLPCYRVNAFQEKIRGTMMNKSQREQKEAEHQEAGASPPGVNETREVLAGRTCTVQVRMPKLDMQIPSLKQFGVEVSDECLRVSFPLLPRAARPAYAPLTLWWPQQFCSAQATAHWETQTDTLSICLPTEVPDDEAEFDQGLLNAVF